ncbi:hypothetical protein PVK06_024443 [Gossypium arboreum]|uniref:Aminotransferase-like plant mobile domain-containing protein n=1 Tax=Gossypium arboreum TaxID=29729 RepID=A0ABR0PDQ6_GOSAR|nr:hypothetical protein PVK06_024443 [Gossypium arboreum]
MHTFHLPSGKCTITLRDVNLQLGLPVVTGLVVSADWSKTCEQLLGNVPNKFRDSRIKMRWWNNPVRHSSILTELEDIQLALDEKNQIGVIYFVRPPSIVLYYTPHVPIALMAFDIDDNSHIVSRKEMRSAVNLDVYMKTRPKPRGAIIPKSAMEPYPMRT